MSAPANPLAPAAPAVDIRPVGPEHLQAIAVVHCASFPESALSSLGTEAVRRLYEWQLVGPHEAVALGAFVNDELKGFCVGGIFRKKMSGYLRRNVVFLVSRVAVRPWLMLRGGFRDRFIAALRILRVLPPPTNGVPLYQDSNPHSFGILSIGVHPDLQGHGIGRVLMAEAEAVARQRGFRRMNLSVKTSNYEAIRFYEALAWTRRVGPDGVWHGEMTKWLKG